MCIQHFPRLSRNTIAAFLLLYLIGCSTYTKPAMEAIDQSTFNSSELPTFILGKWRSTEVRPIHFGSGNLKYEIRFETDAQVKFIVIYPNNNTEGYTFAYSFIDQNSIFVENIRILGGETWLLEKQEEGLVVTRIFDGKVMTIMLERIE
jgi:hypothetical protein